MNRRKKQVLVVILAIALVVIGGALPVRAGTKTWKAATTGDWFTVANWVEGGDYPRAGDDVVITNAGASVLLTNSTEYLSSLTLSAPGLSTNTLVFSNWNTTLSATNVTILTNGVMTLPGAFTNDAMSNNVCIVCSNLTIAAGGKIDVDGLGYAGGTNGPGNGPGYGQIVFYYGGGAGHGGWSPRDNSGFGGAAYGSPTNPVAPGSGGCGMGGAGDHRGGNGGGAVRIEATGAILVNGTITANGLTGGPIYIHGGGGSGGSILIRCRTLDGSTGVVRANGGNGGDGENAGCGAGGRIAVFYDVSAQHALPSAPTLRITSLPGTAGYAADIGSVYFSDAYFLSETLTTNLAGQLWGITSWAPTNLVVTNTWVRFPEEGFRLAVTNDVKVFGSGGKLELGGSVTWNRDMCSTSGPTLTVGGNLILTNGGSLYVYAGMTNGVGAANGAFINVAGDVVVATNAAIYPYSHSTNGGSPYFLVRNLTLAKGGQINANGKGFSSGIGGGANGYGPGGGIASGSWFGGGAGYGGKGGQSLDRPSVGGSTYGSSNAPTAPGSGGANGLTAGNSILGFGGGLVWIEASQRMSLDGTITANGRTPAGGNIEAGGSGGGIYLRCRTLSGSNGVLRANGGNASNTSNGGGGGGGRIAVWRERGDPSVFTYSVAAGTGYPSGNTSEVGTVVWGWLPPPGTVIMIH